MQKKMYLCTSAYYTLVALLPQRLKLTLLKNFLHSANSFGALHSWINFKVTLILVFESNSNCFFFGFYPTVRCNKLHISASWHLKSRNWTLLRLWMKMSPNLLASSQRLESKSQIYSTSSFPQVNDFSNKRLLAFGRVTILSR